ncbi:hypothetical protein AFCA_003428 [Aspergillus flavus]|uniref:RanBP1 domain protein n=1 Tax=Aspergillus flavus TaxID=5059 RepID=A0AB74C408_ASPFL|nr:RanBP1 domain protein [Aspergillus flavus]UDD55841.1 hypothetical protein AFCA_003428 [Aspergillus flavus]
MSKRSAQGPQGDKDSNLFDFNMNSTPDEKPQRATAAQMAQRKIKDVRRRARPNTAAPSTTASFGGPFNSLNPNTVSTPSVPQPISNGFTFGQSQSFPGASSNPSQPTQNGSTPFSFGSGGSSSSSFNFSSSFGGSGSTTSNPFSSMTAGSTTQSSDGGSFSGFKGNMFNVPPAGSSAPAQQPLPSGGLFGTGSQQNNTTGGLFGSSTTSGSSGQPATAAPATTGSIFGQNSASSSAPSTNVFGQSASNKPSPFGQSTAFGESMQTSPDAKNNGAQSKPPIFGGGASQTGFGTSTNFASPGAGSLFGGSASKPAETPKPLFGAKPTEQSTPSTSLFGATTQPSSTPSPASSTPAASSTTAAPSPSIFGTSSSAKPTTSFQNPFQSTNLFGTPASSTAAPALEDKEKQEKKPEESQPKTGFQFTPSTGGPSLFSKSASSAAPLAPSSGLFQPPSTGSLFAPKPSVEQNTSSVDQDKAKPAEGNPFSSLFAPKPATPAKPAGEQKPSTEQKPLSSSGNAFGNLFAPKPSTPSEGSKTSQPEKAATPTPLFSTPTSGPDAPKSSGLFAQSPLFSAPTVGNKTPAPAVTAPTPSQSPFKVNGTSTASSASSASATEKSSTTSFEDMRPSGLPDDLDKASKEEVETLYRMRMLNECFKREASRLDPTKDDFDALVQFYMRVRDTIGAPAGPQKRKAADESATADGHSVKKVKPFGLNAANKEDSSPATTTTATGSVATNIFGASQATPTTSKRKVADEDENTASPGKRVNEDSTTASIFAQSFSKSINSGSSDEPTKPNSTQSVTSSARPSTPDSDKPALFSTTPISSPPKPLFAASTTTKDNSTSTSLFSQSGPSFKPTFTASTNGTSTNSNPFVLKPSGDKEASSAPAPIPGMPKFGAGATNFFAQFKAQVDKDAEKEKEKRKAEDFDSDEEDEAEWEKRDAEERRKKLEALESQAPKRSKFVPGKGFSFEDDEETSDLDKKEETAPTSDASTSSIFDKKTDSSAKPNNIFGHLSATPSEAEENDDADDTEEASAAGDEPEDMSKDTSLAPASEDESNEYVDAKAGAGSGAENSANDSSDDGDLTKALKKSKQEKTATNEQSASDTGASGRSLFDRVEYKQDGTLKRQDDEEQKPLSTFFNSSKYASSFNSPGTPNPFAPTPSKSDAEKDDAPTSKPATPNPFASLFGSPSPTPAAGTPSIFAPSAAKAGADNTWKMNSPIKFASDSNAASTSKLDSASATPAADSSKPFSTLFGAASATKPASSGTGSPSPGFTFGGPAQPPSFLAPSTVSSAAASRASTPGITSDTGAEESGDGDAAEALPQANLAQSRAGEENEDVVIETRARGLKLTKDGWNSQGVGFLRVLKDRTTSRGRVILRADPSGKIVLNASLIKQLSYTVKGTSVHFLVPQADGPPEQWAIRVKKEEAERLGTAMEETKA